MAESPRTLVSRKSVVQIAGITSADEARMLVECGVDFLGFPLEPRHGGGDVSEVDAAGIIRAIPPRVFGVLITYSNVAGDVASICRNLGVSVVQLHGDIAVEEIRRIRELSPGLFVVKTLVVRGNNLDGLVGEVNRMERYVDAFLTDTFDPETGRWGATGKTHDWSISRRIVECTSRPVILAGGLTPENVHRAICEVGPAGVDVHTGVEDSSGRKNRELVERFIEQARKAFNSK
jgi:phosphoribosylanthranilate isomerase